MKVLMIARRVTAKLSAPHYAMMLSKALINYGCKVFILTSEPQATLEEAKIIKTFKLFAGKRIAPMTYTLLAKLVKRKHGIQVVHGHGYTFMDDITTVHFMRKAFVRYVAELGYSIFFRKSEIFFEELILKSSKHLIAPSNMGKECLVRFYGINQEKISVIYNGVDIDRFKPPSSKEKVEARKRLGLEDDIIYVGFVGPPKWKGFEYLLHAIAKLKSDICVIAVNIKGEEYVKLIQELGLKQRVKRLPLFSDMPLFYKAIDIFVLPSVFDTFSLSTLEAMASGLPVIVSNNTGSSEIVKDGRNGLIWRIGDIDKLAELIEYLAQNDRVRRNMGFNARRTAMNFSWNNVAEKVLDVYESLLKR